MAKQSELDKRMAKETQSARTLELEKRLELQQERMTELDGHVEALDAIDTAKQTEAGMALRDGIQIALDVIRGRIMEVQVRPFEGKPVRVNYRGSIRHALRDTSMVVRG